MAERVGFEPTVEFPLHTLSKRAPSTTRTSLRYLIWGLCPQTPYSLTRATRLPQKALSQVALRSGLHSVA